ncbi:MAG: DUF1801 domain-containing protein [Polyangia bacterium]
MTAAAQIAGFLAKYTPAMQKEARAARRRLRARMPTAVEMVYDNYNALVFGFAPGDRASEAILSLAVLPDHVTLCFLQGKGLDDPERLLRGSGNVVRHIKLESAAALDAPAIQALIAQALRRAKVPLPKNARGSTVVKSISAKQRPRRPR